MPWCIQKCPYCDFNSHKKPEHFPENAYIEALLDDLTHDLRQFPSRPIHSIFIGGGTPSLFSAKAYDKLFTGIQKQLPFSKNIEITLEANPGTFEQARFKDYHHLGINRLSLGIQSFHSQHLQALGRIHDDKQARFAIEQARLAGFDNINIDLMHGLPNQSVAEGLDDLNTALSFQPEHLSWYQLTIEPNTVFYKQRPTLPSEDICGELEQAGLTLLRDHHYLRYEISAFCLPPKYSNHNMNYWHFGDYYGIGAGAHGKLTSDDGTIYRTQKIRQPHEYLNHNKPYLSDIKPITPENLIFEFMLNTSRLEEKIPLHLFTETTGLPVTHLYPYLNIAAQKNLITIDQTSWQVTILGRQFTNDLQAIFL